MQIELKDEAEVDPLSRIPRQLDRVQAPLRKGA